MTKKRKRKLAAPKDCNDVPIEIGDWLMFSDGPFHVDTLTYHGKGFESVINGRWTAENEDGDICDNLSAGKVVTI